MTSIITKNSRLISYSTTWKNLDRTNALQKEIIDGLNAYLGLNHDIYLNVKVMNTEAEQHKEKQAEVVESQPVQSRVK